MAFKYSVEDGVSNSSVVNRSNNPPSSGSHTTVVELYTTILCIVLLFTAALIGTLLNTALLLAARIKRSVRTLQYGLHYAVAGVNIVFCSVWLPLHVVQVITNMQGDGVHEILCFTNIAVFNLCIAVLVFLIFFLAIQRLYQLSSLPQQNLRQAVVRGFIVSFSIGCVSATALCIEFPWNIDYKVCTAGAADNIKMGHLWFSVASILFTVIYSLVLLITMLILWIATLAVRHKMAQMLSKDENQDDQRMSDTLTPDASNAKSFCSVTMDHPSAATTSSRKESTGEVQPVIKQLAFVEPKKSQDPDSEEEEDDMFDMKMRMRAQKATSGRRHTVANIGLGDSLFGFARRRGSLEDNRPKTNYNYVRKWSVDITALQDQLENPKMQGRPMPFGDLLALKDKSMAAPIKEDKLEEHNGESKVEDSIAEHEEEDEEAEKQQAEEQKAEQVTFTDETDTEEVHPEPKESDPLAFSTEKPAIVVNGNSPRSHGNRVDFAAEDTEQTGLDTETLQKYHREVAKTNKCLLLQLCTLLCLLPYTSVQLLQPVMSPQLNRNLSYIAMSACVIMCCLQPAILVWMDIRLQNACHKLRNKLTSWRCVCYCNIGKGKKCFGRPSDLDDPGQTTVIA